MRGREVETRRCETEGLVAVNSKLGWLLSGPLKHETRENKAAVMMSMHSMVSLQNDTETLNSKVEKFWDMDTLGIKEDEKSVYDKCMEAVKFVDGRYEVHYPFKENHPLIEDNYTLSLARLKALKLKLDRDPKLLEKYDEIIQSYIDLGILEKADSRPVVGEVTYIPHRCLIRVIKRRRRYE